MGKTYDYVVLTGELDIVERRMLTAMLTSGQVRSEHEWVNEWPSDAKFVLSVGKAALDTWHQWRLIQVGANHGSLFRHDGVPVLVIEHPSVLLQRSFSGQTARQMMRRDLATLEYLLLGWGNGTDTKMKWCGMCQRARVKGGESRRRVASWWVEGLDDAGLCEDHYRGRSKIKSRWEDRTKKKSGSREAQMKGQMEMYAGDGTELVVRKG